MVDRDHVQAMASQRFEHRRDFAIQHRHVAGDSPVLVAANEIRPPFCSPS
jgi:hypothetical protein